MQAFRLALSFLTIIPSGVTQELDAGAFGKSTKYFPVVGMIIGLMLALLYFVISPQIPEITVSMILVVALVVITRALHIDAVADTFDGLLGGRDKDSILMIMKDSRVGSFGVVAIVAIVGLKLSLLASVTVEMMIGALIAFPVIGRWSACYAMVTQPYARAGGGLGASFVEGAGRFELIWASVITIIIAFVALKLIAIPVLIAALAFTLVYIRLVKKKIGGMTGDTLGALIEMAEVVALFVIALV